MTDGADTDEEWIRIDAASEILGVKTAHAGTLMRDARVQSRQRAGAVGRSFEYLLSDVLALKEDRSAPASSNYCTYAGALGIKRRIEEYWRKRGATVTVELVEAGYVPSVRAARVDIRSDMQDGWPVTWKPR